MWHIAVFVCVGWIFSVCLHEFGHAIVAYYGGDTSVKDKGYLTLNPLKYADPLTSLAVPLFFLLIGGIALPGAAVYIDQRRLRNRWWKSAVSAAGPAASALVALALAIGFRLLRSRNGESSPWILPALACLILLQIFAALFNLLPIPPLDGYGILEPWLPNYIRTPARKFSKYGIFVIFGLIWFVEPLSRSLWELIFSLVAWLGVPPKTAQLGLQTFTGSANGVLLVAIIGAVVLRKLMQKPHEKYYEKGRSLLQSQKYEEAIAAYDQVIALQADDAKIWVDRSYALGVLRRYAEAIASCDKAIFLDPQNSLAWYNKACSYASQNQVELALENLERALTLDTGRLRLEVMTDKSFATIREDDRFQQLLRDR